MDATILDVERDPRHVAASVEDLVALVTRRCVSIDNCGAIGEVDKDTVVLDIEVDVLVSVAQPMVVSSWQHV